MKNYNVGIIGYGGFGKFLHHWWDKLEGVTVTAVSDRSFANEMDGDLRHYTRWEDLITDESVDIVSIATPPAFHVEIACAAMRQNKHVLLEKPVAITEEGAQEILRTQQETGMAITVDHMLRYNPIIRSLIQLSQQETFGKLRHVVVSNYAQDEGLPPKHWFWDKAISGGIFVEHGVHFFDIVNALTTQNVSTVCGFAHSRNEKQQDQVAATVLYDGGLIASHYHSFSGPGFFEQTTIRLTYDLAKIEVEGWMPMKGKINALVNADTKEALSAIPWLTVENISGLNNISDISRPEGWGDTPEQQSSAIRSAGIAYDVTEMVSATFDAPHTKSEVYGLCLQHILLDLIAKIEDSSHQLKVTIENAASALRIAVAADRMASGRAQDTNGG